MADSSSILDALFTPLFHSSPFLSRDNDALTKALQISISEPPTAAGAGAAISSPCSSISTSDSMLNPTTIPSSWAADIPAAPAAANSERSGAGKGVALAPSGGRVTKRKSRASKRSQTTYINADPANFRQMVQQVTGIRFEPGMMMIGGDTVPPLVKPEPQRMPVMVQQGCLLPTLDTSAHMLSNQAREGATVRAERSTVTGGFGVESGGGMSFPTLESWGMIV